ncbi:hypothetical protein NE865_02844 [Phthorimaea operculella]|nr:hypothetical protein NE865_02844 [Phthorimaea operculella]
MADIGIVLSHSLRGKNTQKRTFRYISIEYPQITHLNPKIISYANSSVRRYSRKDPVYYYELHANVLVPLDNKFSYQFYFYKEWMPNVYKPTFLEMHYKHCDLLEKDKLFGRTMRQGKLSGPCPHPPGEYHLYNMSVPSAELPESFPFSSRAQGVSGYLIRYHDRLGLDR